MALAKLCGRVQRQKDPEKLLSYFIQKFIKTYNLYAISENGSSYTLQTAESS